MFPAKQLSYPSCRIDYLMVFTVFHFDNEFNGKSKLKFTMIATIDDVDEFNMFGMQCLAVHYVANVSFKLTNQVILPVCDVFWSILLLGLLLVFFLSGLVYKIHQCILSHALFPTHTVYLHVHISYQHR